jgi:predicted Zn finger-like uncharacterized protein
MRLVCPSCGAEYEVDDSVIPEAGRDVQCSNCGQAWFQASAAQLQAQKNEDSAQDASLIWQDSADDRDDSADASSNAGTAPDPQAEVAGSGGAAGGQGSDESSAATTTDPTKTFRRRTLDDAVLNVLREEAAREARARENEGATLETQPDLGLSSAALSAAKPAEEIKKDRVAHTRGGADESDDEDSLVSRGSRRELLPDIEEINSTLRATSERGSDAASRDAPETLQRRRSGFRLGFSISLISAAILLSTYLLAPIISEQVPVLAPVMDAYVHGVDKARLWIDAKMQSSTEAMRNK